MKPALFSDGEYDFNFSVMLLSIGISLVIQSTLQYIGAQSSHDPPLCSTSKKNFSTSTNRACGQHGYYGLRSATILRKEHIQWVPVCRFDLDFFSAHRSNSAKTNLRQISFHSCRPHSTSTPFLADVGLFVLSPTTTVDRSEFITGLVVIKPSNQM